jgi:hypothetical protein
LLNHNSVTEESTVREAASASTQTVANVLPEETFQDDYARMVSRLATNEWFTARISSAALIATAYKRLKEDQQKEFLSNYCSLCRDDTPMVRRVASQYLGQMLETVIQVSGRSSLQEDGTVTTLLIPLYEELASSEQPVRTRSDCGVCLQAFVWLTTHM